MSLINWQNMFHLKVMDEIFVMSINQIIFRLFSQKRFRYGSITMPKPRAGRAKGGNSFSCHFVLKKNLEPYSRAHFPALGKEDTHKEKPKAWNWFHFAGNFNGKCCFKRCWHTYFAATQCMCVTELQRGMLV